MLDDVNLIVHLKELWHRRYLVAIATVLALAISILVVFQVSVLPPSIAKRNHVDAKGSIEILVDSARSPIADARRDLSGLTARAGVFARLMAGGDVVGRIARANDIPFKQIDVAGPAPVPGEAPGAEQAPAQIHPYGISIAQSQELPIVSVQTRAPSVRLARGLAAAAPAAIRDVVTSIQAEQDTPAAKRVEVRVLGPALAVQKDDSRGKKMALALFVVLLALFLVLILGVPRLVAAWREAPSAAAGEEERDEPLPGPDPLRMFAGTDSDPDGDDTEATPVGRGDA